MKGICFVFLAVGLLAATPSQSAEDGTVFVESLLKRMTFDEKVGQTVQLSSGLALNPVATDSSKEKASEGLLALLRMGKAGALSGSCGIEKFNLLQRAALSARLGIPILVGTDVIHGGRIVYPIPIAMACAWDDGLWERAGRFNAVETGMVGANWTYAPMVDVARDARWGRISEGPGQDPLIASRYAAAMVRGIQREPTDGSVRIAACLKHFVGYGAAVAGRDYNEVDMSDQQLHDVYLQPFAAGIRSGVLTVMSGFHSFNGKSCSVNGYLLTDVLRKELGFAGLCVSDNGAIHETGPVGHCSFATIPELAAASLAAGVNMDMVRRQGRAFPEGLPEARARGLLDEAALDARVREILLVKLRLGLFDRPYINAAAQSNAYVRSEFLTFAREAAAKSTVLLKNENQVLPLAPKCRVALIGTLATNLLETAGCWSLHFETHENATLLDGLCADGVDVRYTGGFDVRGTFLDEKGIVAACTSADLVIGCFGETIAWNGENSSRATLELSDNQIRAMEIVRRSGKPLVAVLFNGRPLAIPRLLKEATAVVEAWNPGSCGGWGVADVLTGRVEPYGRLVCDFPYATGQCPLYYNRPSTGRPHDPKVFFSTRYVDCPFDPLLPFGAGLAYTTFAISKVTAKTVGCCVALSCQVANTGSRRGHAVVQAYQRRLFDGQARPVRELMDYRRVSLEPGARADVEFMMDVEPGTYDFFLSEDSVSGNPCRLEVR